MCLIQAALTALGSALSAKSLSEEMTGGLSTCHPTPTQPALGKDQKMPAGGGE